MFKITIFAVKGKQTHRQV